MIRNSKFLLFTLCCTFPLATLASDKTPTTSAVKALSQLPNSAIAESASLQKALPAFEAEYTFYYHGKALGKGIRQLEYLPNGEIKYRYHSEGKWFVFSDKRDETSISELKNNTIIPKSYRFERTGTGKDKLVNWQYSINKNEATNLKDKKVLTIEFPDGVQDSLSYHLQHRINLMLNHTPKTYHYPVINTHGELSEKTYEYAGEEELTLPYGKVKTVKYKREVKSKKRVTYAWFAPSLNYLLVKLNQYKKDSQEFEIQLNSVETK